MSAFVNENQMQLCQWNLLIKLNLNPPASISSLPLLPHIFDYKQLLPRVANGYFAKIRVHDLIIEGAPEYRSSYRYRRLGRFWKASGSMYSRLLAFSILLWKRKEHAHDLNGKECLWYFSYYAKSMLISYSPIYPSLCPSIISTNIEHACGVFYYTKLCKQNINPVLYNSHHWRLPGIYSSEIIEACLGESFHPKLSWVFNQ